MSGKRLEWLSTTVNAVRELMLKRAVCAADKDARRDAEVSLSALK